MDYLAPLLLGAALALLVQAAVYHRQALRLREAYRLVLVHGRRDFLEALQALALAEEEAEASALPEVIPGHFPRPQDAPSPGPLHAAPLGLVPVPLGLDPLDVLDDLGMRKSPEPRS